MQGRSPRETSKGARTEHHGIDRLRSALSPRHPLLPSVAATGEERQQHLSAPDGTAVLLRSLLSGALNGGF